MVGSADTGQFDPNFSNPNYLVGQDPYLQHAVVTQGFVQQDLGALPGANSSISTWVNDSGVVVGISENGSIDPLIGIPEGVAVLWKNGQITNLGTLGGNQSIAFAVNSSGQVNGCAANAVPDDNSIFGWGTQTRGFLYQNGTMQDIGTLGGTDTLASLINDAGQVAGGSYTASMETHAFVWTNGKMQDLGTLGGTYSYPNAINSTGQAVGVSNLAGNSIAHAFFWDGTKLHDLGSLASGFQKDYSEALWMNDAGDIVGDSLVSPTASHAFLWKNGVMTDLGTLPGDRCSIAWGINSKDQVVGASGLCGSPQHAFLWQNGQMYDLSHVFFNAVLTSAFFISDSGDIGAVGNEGGGSNGGQAYLTMQRGFLLIPFPSGSDNDTEQDGTGPAEKVGASHNRFGSRSNLPGRFGVPPQ